jgi:hypothetical protein
MATAINTEKVVQKLVTGLAATKDGRHDKIVTEIREKNGDQPEIFLHTLLTNAEGAAQRNDVSRRKWQFLSLLSLMLIVPACAAIVWLYTDLNVMTTRDAKLIIENKALVEQANLAGAKTTDPGSQLETLQSENLRLLLENANLKAQNDVLLSRLDSLSKTPQTVQSAQGTAIAQAVAASQSAPLELNQSRLDAIKRGTYPADMTKGELVAVLGQPDRILKSDKYEQLIYFNRSPGRFWFSNGPFLNTTE